MEVLKTGNLLYTFALFVQQKLFFHYSNVRGPVESLELGGGLEFSVATDRRTGKLVAANVVPLPPGTVQVEEILPERQQGTIEREPGRRGVYTIYMRSWSTWVAPLG